MKNLIDAYIFLRTVTIHKVLNGFLLRLSFLLSIVFKTYIHWGKPESISIEPTNICNLSCPECASGNNSLTRKRTFLKTAGFYKIIDSTYTHLSYLQLFFQGEPFLNPDIYNFIKYTTDKNIYTAISTNGHFFTPDNCKKIVESNLQRIIISVDGTTPDIYEKYRVGGNLQIVLNGIKELIKTKLSLKSKTPYIIIQFVVFATNEHQIPEIKRLAKQMNVDKLELKTAQIENFINGNHLIPKNKKYSRYIKTESGKYILNEKKNFVCKRIWNSTVITADKNVLPCCYDKNAEYTYGTTDSQNTVNKIWKNNKAVKFRKTVIQNNHPFNICKNCGDRVK